MKEQYLTVNECISLLKSTNLPTHKKLRIEVQLIHMKRLLLNTEYPQKRAFADAAHQGLITLMSEMCSGSHEAGILTEQMERLSWLITALADRGTNKEAVSLQPFPYLAAA